MNTTKKHGLRHTRIYNAYGHMKNRCNNTKNKRYKDYGGRGIKICNEWLDKDFGVLNFYIWSINNGYNDNLSIDRINNDKGYYPENCRWTNQSTQSINRRIFKNNTSGYIGVKRHSKSNGWEAVIKYRNKVVFGKFFKNKKDAVEARNNFIIDNNLPHKTEEYVDE